MPKNTFSILHLSAQFNKNDRQAKMELCISKYYFSLNLVSIYNFIVLHFRSDQFMIPTSVLANSLNRLLNVALHHRTIKRTYYSSLPTQENSKFDLLSVFQMFTLRVLYTIFEKLADRNYQNMAFSSVDANWKLPIGEPEISFARHILC